MQKRIVFGALAAVLGVFLGAGGVALAQVQVTQCGQVVPRGAVGILTGDLDCSQPGECNNWEGGLPNCLAVRLEHAATLQLEGFSLIGPGPSVFRIAVDCDGSCNVIGPGTISGFTQGVRAYDHKRSIGGTATVTGVTITDVSDRCVNGRRARVRECTITRCGQFGVLASKTTVVESVVSENTEHGIRGESVSLRNVEASNNGGYGAHARTHLRRGGILHAQDSVLVGNGGACPDEPGGPCVDVEGEKRVLLRNTEYGTCTGPGCQ